MSELPIDFFKKLEETKRNLDQQIQTMKDRLFISDCKLFFSCVYCYNNHSKATYSEQRHRIDDLTDCHEKLKLQRDIQASRVKELQAKGTAIMIKESPAEQLKKIFARQTNQLVPRRTAKKVPRTNTATNMVACCFCQRDNCTPLLISDCGLLFNPSCMKMSNLDPEWFSDGECDSQI